MLLAIREQQDLRRPLRCFGHASDIAQNTPPGNKLGRHMLLHASTVEIYSGVYGVALGHAQYAAGCSEEVFQILGFMDVITFSTEQCKIGILENW